jgi:hypothetical protein
MPITEWIDDMHAGLMLDFVATRDIEAGEEVLIDYGEEWEMAWRKHLQSWRPPKGANSYVDAVHRNEQELILRTVGEGHYNEADTRLHCRNIYRTWSGLGDTATGTDDDEDEEEEDDDSEDRKLYPCRVVHRAPDRNGEYVYTAEITKTVVRSKTTEIHVDVVLFGVSRDAFVFVDEPLSRE